MSRGKGYQGSARQAKGSHRVVNIIYLIGRKITRFLLPFGAFSGTFACLLEATSRLRLGGLKAAFAFSGHEWTVTRKRFRSIEQIHRVLVAVKRQAAQLERSHSNKTVVANRLAGRNTIGPRPAEDLASQQHVRFLNLSGRFSPGYA